MRAKSTIEFLGLWETINNPAFKGVEFDSFRLRVHLWEKHFGSIRRYLAPTDASLKSFKLSEP
ncbi:hypothetical protein A3A67_03145 [Candidatus Peribacteria bacterium RIFCSPLOWO2_01_FULL_51_18]|nr:MAG: hypothetical protein A3C52_01145 [Candidatus Peribacteria bacterium RIFCSPHIGHO2_02_FULL_51_15]OGJ66431.1 MAG: hypothetical protein A3A67_03145 [Candidatus Peribacteria bacterium RIFCSPLOWO2_01_FULL_51_18]